MAAVECAQRRQASTAASAPVDARTRSATGGFFDVFHARGLHAVGITFPDGIVYRPDLGHAVFETALRSHECEPQKRDATAQEINVSTIPDRHSGAQAGAEAAASRSASADPRAVAGIAVTVRTTRSSNMLRCWRQASPRTM
jgi:hypothetical protein